MGSPPDQIFEDSRLAAVYDALDSDRTDLDQYEAAVVDEFGARSALDIGCGTGTFALRLSKRGLGVTGVDPAAASVRVARNKHGGDAVTWIVGTARNAPDSKVDAITMTAKVAQVFLTDEDWNAVLRAAYARLAPGGVLIFESRRAEVRAWERWTRELTHHSVSIPGGETVERWVHVTAVDGELVTFEEPTVFHSDGARLDSLSTLRFRSRESIEESLRAAGFNILAVRDARYAPAKAWMYFGRRP